MPIVVAYLYRVGVPPLSIWLLSRFGFDLTAYYGLLVSFYVMTAPSMVGTIIGFLLLDDRDDQVLSALMVTPLSIRSYLGYRILVPLVAGFVVTIAGYRIVNLVPLGTEDLIWIALLASFSGPLTALFLASFAENKVTGFALMKMLNSFNMIPAIAFFVSGRWQLLAGIMPAYWPMKMTWQAVEGKDYAMYGVVGVVVNAAILLIMLRKFTLVMHR
jgi:fluoroquinolone transport system permease protein